jgi:hypothetical protein
MTEEVKHAFFPVKVRCLAPAYLKKFLGALCVIQNCVEMPNISWKDTGESAFRKDIAGYERKKMMIGKTASKEVRMRSRCNIWTGTESLNERQPEYADNSSRKVNDSEKEKRIKKGVKKVRHGDKL